MSLDSTQAITQTNYLYQGDYLERQLNIYFTADGRYYDPWLGKYLQPDAIGGPPLIPQAADRYQYAGNSPTGVGWAGTALSGGGGLIWDSLLQSTASNSLSAVVSEAAMNSLVKKLSTTGGERWLRIVGPGHSVESARWALWALLLDKSTARELAEGTLGKWEGWFWYSPRHANRFLTRLASEGVCKTSGSKCHDTGE